MNQLERVARAICKAERYHWTDEPEGDYYTVLAQAAIDAMKPDWQPLTEDAPRGMWLRVRKGSDKHQIIIKFNDLGEWNGTQLDSEYATEINSVSRNKLDYLVTRGFEYQILADAP